MIMNNKLFVYGILKRNFSLDLSRHGAKFIGKAQIEGADLYKIGRGVGLRFAGKDHKAIGELFEIPERLWPWLDQLESNGFAYTRSEVEVQRIDWAAVENGTVRAWVYEHTFPGMRYTETYDNGTYPLEAGY
jgi:gamma-glutamylcyclotransferase (GGCT)/AIG2-like uncharacterized protein YtfP